MQKLIRVHQRSSARGAAPPSLLLPSPAASESDEAISLTHCRVTACERNGPDRIAGQDTREGHIREQLVVANVAST